MVFSTQNVSTSQIQPSPLQPRLPGDVTDLTISLQQTPTIYQPLIVYLDDEGVYRTWMGERRYRAAVAAGLETVPCVVRPKPDFLTFLAGAVTENEARRALEPLAVAWTLETYYLIANLVALGRKYEALGHLVDIQQQVETVAHSAAEIADELERQAKRQQEVINFLRFQLDEALSELGKSRESWRPLVSWQTCVEQMGLSLSDRRRRQVLELLTLADDVQGAIVGQGMSEYATRALASLDPERQRQVVAQAQQSGRPLADLTHADIVEQASSPASSQPARSTDTAVTDDSDDLDDAPPARPAQPPQPQSDPKPAQTPPQPASYTTLRQHITDAAALAEEVGPLLNEQERETLMAEISDLLARIVGQ